MFRGNETEVTFIRPDIEDGARTREIERLADECLFMRQLAGRVERLVIQVGTPSGLSVRLWINAGKLPLATGKQTVEDELSLLGRAQRFRRISPRSGALAQPFWQGDQA